MCDGDTDDTLSHTNHNNPCSPNYTSPHQTHHLLITLIEQKKKSRHVSNQWEPTPFVSLCSEQHVHNVHGIQISYLTFYICQIVHIWNTMRIPQWNALIFWFQYYRWNWSQYIHNIPSVSLTFFKKRIVDSIQSLLCSMQLRSGSFVLSVYNYTKFQDSVLPVLSSGIFPVDPMEPTYVLTNLFFVWLQSISLLNWYSQY